MLNSRISSHPDDAPALQARTLSSFLACFDDTDLFPILRYFFGGRTSPPPCFSIDLTCVSHRTCGYTNPHHALFGGPCVSSLAAAGVEDAVPFHAYKNLISFARPFIRGGVYADVDDEGIQRVSIFERL